MKKKLIAVILELIGIISVLACAVVCFILRIKNPDMTGFRMMLDYPWTTIWGLASLGAFYIGKCMRW